MKSDKRGKGKSAKPPGPRSASSSEIRSVDGISSGRPHAFSIPREDIGLTRMLETLKPHDHLCLIYESQEEWRAAAAPFISIGLKQGEKCIYIVDTSTAEEIRKYLLEEGVDVASAEKSGQLSILHETEAYTREGSFDPDRMIALLISETEKAVSEGYPALRTTGEMTWVLRGYPGSAKLLEYEAKLNRDLFPKYPCLAICQYDRWKFDPEIIKGVIMTHPLLVRGSRVYRNFYYVDPGEFLNKKHAEREVQHWLNNVEREQQMWEELRESEEKYRTLVEQSVQGLVIIQDFRIVYVNGVFAEICGYAVEELLSLSPEKVATMIHPEDQALVWGHFRDRLAGKPVPPRYEYRGIRKDGSVIWLEMFASLIEYHGKSAIQGAIIDITERKRAEESLKKSEERFRTSVENLPEGFAILSVVRDRDGKIIDFKYDYINEAGCKMNQKPLEEHMGKTLLELLPTHKGIGLFDEYARVVETGQPLTKEFLIYEGVYGGRKRLRQVFNVQITRLEDGLVTTWQDITDKKKGEELLRQSEERLRLLVENAKDVVIMADLEGSIIYYNGSPEYGITAEQVLGKNPFSIFDPVIAARLMNQLKRVVKDGEVLTFENVIPLNGESYWFLNQMYPIQDEKGRMIAVGLIARNITERKRAEDREQLAYEVLNLLNRWETTTNTIREILLLLKKKMGFEAVGIRLREGDDFPYFETNGFSEDFVQAERHLCAYDKEGKIVRDGKGNPVLECMCGNILCGRTDAALAFFTAGGSFWTNSTTDLLASTTEEDRQSRTRNRCNGEGYESVALIPLWSGDEIIGLLQLNDRRRNQFTSEMIHFFEGVGASVGIALSRKRAEKALWESEDRYRDLVEHSHDLICTHDLEGRILSVNRGALRILGYDHSTVLSKNIRDILAPEVRNEFDSYLVTIQREGAANGLMVIQASSGEKRIWEYNNTLRTEGVSTPIVRGMAHDITERKRVEEAVRESLNRWETTFDGIKDSIFLLDKEGVISQINKNATKLFGKTEKEIQGHHCWEIVHGTSEPIAGCPIVRMKQSKQRETMFLPVDDKWYEVTVDPLLNQDGNLLGAVHIISDITERKRMEETLWESEANLNRAQTVAHVGSWYWEVTEDVLKCSAETYRMFGVAEGTPVTSGDFMALVHPEDRDYIDRSWQAALAGAAYDTENRIVVKGEVKWVHQLADLEFDSKGNIKAIGTVQDITERKQAEEALRRAEENFHRSLDDSSLGVRIVTTEGETVYANRAILEIYGYDSIEELLAGLQKVPNLGLVVPS